MIVEGFMLARVDILLVDLITITVSMQEVESRGLLLNYTGANRC
jgi:hypothetical protein